MEEEVEIRWHAEHNGLELRCSAKKLSRLVDLIGGEIALPDEVSSSEIHAIEILGRDCTIDASMGQGWRDRLALLGCAIVGFLICIVFTAGIEAVVGWFRG